ncbi:amidohydrolase [Testudinibacter sp. TR-2022]|nr:amidohydrolase [Pasteurellaceae bacterium Phil11]TNH23183.1 amidohydrolase [Testudinibacter sp. TR-2022]TNH23662.1 amidohydrolase [Testudinibacter sp. TR-2022]
MKIITVEEHVLHPALAQAALPATAAAAPYLRDWGSRVTDGADVADWSRPHIVAAPESMQLLFDMDAGRLQHMDAAGIDMQVLSVGGAPQMAAMPQAAALHRAANDAMAEAAAKHPGRFAAFATLPWQDTEAAVRELERAVKELGFKGALINGRPDADFLDHPRFAPLLAAFSDLQVPLYVHPGLPVEAVRQAYYTGFDKEVDARLAMFGWGWHNEAGIQVLRMLLGGCFDRHPNLQVISGHWGEMLPFYLQRLDDSLPQAATGLGRSLTQTYREQVYVTPSGMLTLPHFLFIRELMGSERILYSIDYPYQSLDGARSWLENLPVSDAEKALIAHQNAQKLLKL